MGTIIELKPSQYISKVGGYSLNQKTSLAAGG